MQDAILNLKEAHRQLDLQNKIAEVFVKVPNGDMYGEVLEVLLKFFESKHGFFGYINRKGDLVCPSLTRNIWDQCKMPDKSIVFPHDCWAGIWKKAMGDQKVLYSNENGVVPEGHIPITRSLCAPIIHHKELVGCIAVSNRDYNYNNEDVRMIKIIADRIAPLLHARLQRDEALDALKEAAHRAETYLNLAPAIFVALDKEGNITLINDYGAKLLGYESNCCIGKNWFDFFIPERDRSKVRTVFNTLLKGEVGIFSDYENRILTANGEEKIIAWKNTVVKGDMGEITGTLSAGDDITEQRLIEKDMEKYWSAQEKALRKELNKLSLFSGA